MSRNRSLSLITAVAALAFAAPLSAQQKSIIDVGTLDAAVSARSASRTTESRAVIASALASSEARAVAAKMGVSSETLATQIASLDDVSAQSMAEQILAGGESRIVISTTAIIIGLLLIILLTRN